MKTAKPHQEYGDMLRRIRKSREKTQEQVAETAGVSLYTYKAWECGYRRPSTENVRPLAAALGCDLASLLP